MADNVNITEGAGKTVGGDDISSVIYQRIKLIHGADGTNDGDVASANPLPVTVNRVTSIVDGTVSVENITRVRNVVDGTLTTVTGVDRVRNVIDGTLSVVTFIPAVQRVQNVVDGTLTTVTGVDRVRNVIDGTLTTITGVDRVRNVIDGTITTVTRVDRVHNIIDGTISTLGTLTGITNSIQIHLLSTAGTIAVNVGHITDTIAIMAKNGTFAVYFSPSRPAVLSDDQGTSSIFTVTGTTSTAGNNTLVAPSASYNFKVFAYSIQTTGIVSMAPRFTTGASAGATELWRPLITAVSTSSSPIGANLAVSSPSFIFATGTNTTLALYLDTGSLVHYSVSYRKESA